MFTEYLPSRSPQPSVENVQELQRQNEISKEGFDEYDVDAEGEGIDRKFRARKNPLGEKLFYFVIKTNYAFQKLEHGSWEDGREEKTLKSRKQTSEWEKAFGGQEEIHGTKNRSAPRVLHFHHPFSSFTAPRPAGVVFSFMESSRRVGM